MDELRQIEEAVRSYFGARDEERADLAAGELAEFLEVIGNLEDQSRLVSQKLIIRRLEVMNVEGDEATVDLDATDHLVYYAEEAGRIKNTWHYSGPVVVRRVGSAWRVADYVRNGRLRSASMRLHPSGTQEVNGLRIAAVAIDLLADITLLYLRVQNDRAEPAQVDWAAVGTPRLRGWKYLAVGVQPSEFAPRSTTVAFAWRWKGLPVDVQALRLIVVEKGQRVGFDLVIDPRSSGAIRRPQPPPRTLPLRLRFTRGPFALVPALVPLVLVYLFGSWPSVGLVLAGLGALVLLSIPWHRLQGRRLPARRPASAGSGLLAIGAIIFALTGLSWGCPPRSEAAEISDRFVSALLTDGPAATERYLVFPEQQRGDLPFVPSVSDRNAARLLRTRRTGTKAECNPFSGFFGVPETDDPCFLYDLPNRQLTVYMTCDGDWKVGGVG
jgi:hypothetical protein